GKPEVPLFCVPGAGANVTSLVELVSCFKAGRAVTGFQPRGLSDSQVPFSTVESAACCYLNALNAIAPKGPVALLGHSFGGWVIFEMAQLLRRSGREVESLTIIDSQAPDGDGPIREYSANDIVMAWVAIFETILGRPLLSGVQEIESLSQAAQRSLVHQRLVGAGFLPRQSQPDGIAGKLRTFAAALRARYCPREAFSGNVRLVLVDDPDLTPEAGRERQERIVRSWKRWLPNLAYLHGPGNHMTCLQTPHVQSLARIIFS
ncbi:MAG TPA: alpha/beta fold hydrolase, partial [Bryobacteraceae bacterium]